MSDTMDSGQDLGTEAAKPTASEGTVAEPSLGLSKTGVTQVVQDLLEQERRGDQSKKDKAVARVESQLKEVVDALATSGIELSPEQTQAVANFQQQQKVMSYDERLAALEAELRGKQEAQASPQLEGVFKAAGIDVNSAEATKLMKEYSEPEKLAFHLLTRNKPEPTAASTVQPSGGSKPASSDVDALAVRMEQLIAKGRLKTPDEKAELDRIKQQLITE